MIPLVVSTYLADREIKNRINATRTMGSKELVAGGKISIHNVHNHKHPVERLGLDQKKTDLLIKGSILAPVILYLTANLSKKSSLLSKVGTSLLLGGALGNWAEHIETGYATDYLGLEVGPKKLRRYVFNLADIAIVLGAFLSILAILFRKKK